jgi:hypothetical protein
MLSPSRQFYFSCFQADVLKRFRKILETSRNSLTCKSIASATYMHVQSSQTKVSKTKTNFEFPANEAEYVEITHHIAPAAMTEARITFPINITIAAISMFLTLRVNHQNAASKQHQ